MLRRITDIETTGTNPATDRIVELACADLSDAGGIVAERQTLVNPEPTSREKLRLSITRSTPTWPRPH